MYHNWQSSKICSDWLSPQDVKNENNALLSPFESNALPKAPFLLAALRLSHITPDGVNECLTNTDFLKDSYSVAKIVSVQARWGKNPSKLQSHYTGWS